MDYYFAHDYGVDACHAEIARNIKPALAFNENCNYDEWKSQVKEKLTELLGDKPEKTDLNITLEWEENQGDFVERRYSFTAEENCIVPCHLWIPKDAPKPCPVVICLQGHSSGMHISMARPKFEGDEISVAGGDRDFAVQIIKQGYAALVLEQRGFGERYSPALRKIFPKAKTTCAHPSMTALMMGRTIIGERIWDVSRAIDMLETIPEIDSDKIALMGNSGGGTATYYTACMEERIKIAMPSCAVCDFKESIAKERHCSCNYIPKIAKYFDMGDIACLIAPRKLVMVAGELDHGFHIEGSRSAFDTISAVYKKAGCSDNCKLVVGDEGHRFYAKPAWPVFNELAGWK